MSLTDSWFRSEGRYLVITYAVNVLTAAVAVFAGYAASQNLNGLLRTIVITSAAAVVLEGLFGPILRWATTLTRFTQTDVQRRTGLVGRRNVAVPWKSIASVEIDRPWKDRLVGLVRVTVTRAGEEGHRMVFDAIPLGLAEEILTRAGKSPSIAHAPLESEAEAEAVIYRSRWRDIITSSILDSRWALVAIPAGLIVADWVNTIDPNGALTTRLSVLPIWVIISVVIVSLFALGLAVSVLRFHGLCARRTPQGFELSYGAIETRTRLIDLADITGFRIHRNALERLLGRARISFITADLPGQASANAVLPSLPVTQVQQIAMRILNDFVPEGERALVGPKRSPSGLLAALVIAIPASATAWGLVQLGDLKVGWGALVAVVLSVAVSRITSFVSAHAFVYAESGVMEIRRSVARIERTWWQVESVHAMRVRSLFGNRLLSATFAVHAGRGRSLTVRSITSQALQYIEQQLTSPSFDQSQERA